MKKKILSILIITLLSFSTILRFYLVYEWKIGTHYFNLPLSNTKEIKLVADECTECFLDWPIDFTLKIRAEKNKNFSSLKFETGNGPELHFYLNVNNPDQILIKGYNSNSGLNWLVNSQKPEIQTVYDIDLLTLKNYSLKYTLTSNLELIKTN